MVNSSVLSNEILEELRFSQEELAELEKARSKPISYDSECPETTPERALRFRRVNPSRNSAGKRA